MRSFRKPRIYEFLPHNFVGNEIGRALARPEGVRAKDGAHQRRKERKGLCVLFS
jgi:hypothetical protein